MESFDVVVAECGWFFLRYNTQWWLVRVVCHGPVHFELGFTLSCARQAQNGENHRFLTVFQPLLPPTLTCPNEIHIVFSHTLAPLPRQISAGSAHRGPSNRPC